MAAAATDKYQLVGSPGTATTLSAPGYTISDASINVGSTTNWPTTTGVIFGIDNATIVDGEEVRTAGSYCVFAGTVNSATSINNLTLLYGTPQNYAAGALTRVYITVSALHNDRLVGGLLVQHNQDGTHGAITSTSATLTTPKIVTSINDSNGNEVIKTPATASATNEITVTNAANGSAPKVSATGSSDTNVNLNLQGRGTGSVQINGTDILAPLFDHVVSGIVISADSAGVNKNYSITSGVVCIGGNFLTVAAVSAQTVGASQDRYIDLRDNGDGTAVYITNEVANNAASQALTAGDMRVGIVVAGATVITGGGAINQGQETKVLPIASAIPYAVTDSLGNLICPRDPNRKLLGYRPFAVFSVASATPTLITGASAPVIVPTGRKVVVTFSAAQMFNSGTAQTTVSVYEAATIGTLTTALDSTTAGANTAAGTYPCSIINRPRTPGAATMFYSGAISGATGTSNISSGYIKIELE